MTTTAHRHRPTLAQRRPEPTKGPYARVPYCDEHRTYMKGCDKCRRYAAWRKRTNVLRVENGERITVPLAEVRAHLDKLTAAGMTPKMICEASGISKSTLKGPLYKESGFVAGWVADMILAVPVPAIPAEPPPLSHVTDATGTLRRIRALARIGWTYRHIADVAQTSHRIEHYAGQKWVTHEVAAAIVRAYDLLSMTPGPSNRTASRAAKAGWAPPLAWDDDTIDDPRAKPADSADADVIDEIAVQRALNGERVPLTRAERDHAFRIGLARGLTPYALSKQLHLSGRTAQDIAARLTTQAA